MASLGHQHDLAQPAHSAGGQAGGARQNASAPAGGGLLLGAIEAPAGTDEQLGQWFRQFRQATGLTPVMIAARLGTDPAVLQAFEAGAVLALPDWPETSRIVMAYARMVGVDPHVALNRIRAQRTAGAPTQPHPPAAYAAQPVAIPSASLPPAPFHPAHAVNPVHSAAPALPQGRPPGQFLPPPTGDNRGWIQLPPRPPGQAVAPLAPPVLQESGAATSAPHTGLSTINPLQPPARPPRPESEAAQRRIALQNQPAKSEVGPAPQRRHPAKLALKYVTAPMIVLAGLWYTVQNPTTVHAALGHLPDPLPQIARAGMDLVLIGTAPTKDGLRMMTTGDPQSRKSDRLVVRPAGDK